MVCCCVHGNEPSSFIKDGKFLDVLSNSDLLKKGLFFKELMPLKVYYKKINEKHHILSIMAYSM